MEWQFDAENDIDEDFSYLTEIRRVFGYDTGQTEVVDFFFDDREYHEDQNSDDVDTNVLSSILDNGKVERPQFVSRLEEKEGMLYALKHDGQHTMLVLYGRNMYESKEEKGICLLSRGRGRPLPYQCVIEAEKCGERYVLLDLVWDSGKMHKKNIIERMEWIRNFLEDAMLDPWFDYQQYFCSLVEVPKGEGVIYVDRKKGYGEAPVYRYKYEETLDCQLVFGGEFCKLAVSRGKELYMLAEDVDAQFSKAYAGKIVEVVKTENKWHVRRFRDDKASPNTYDFYCNAFPKNRDEYIARSCEEKTVDQVRKEFLMVLSEGETDLLQIQSKKEFVMDYMKRYDKNQLLMIMSNTEKMKEMYSKWFFSKLNSGAAMLTSLFIKPVTQDRIDQLAQKGQPEPRSMILKSSVEEFKPRAQEMFVNETYDGRRGDVRGKRGRGRGRRGKW